MGNFTTPAQMRNNLLILSFALLVVACNSQSGQKSTTKEAADSSTITFTNNKSERFIPETKGTEKTDTVIADK